MTVRVDKFCPRCGFPLVIGKDRNYCLYESCDYNKRINEGEDDGI